MALRGKGIERSILITDAVAPALCAPGDYRLGEVEVELKPADRVVLRGGTRLAGSSLRMDRAIENAMRQAGFNLRKQSSWPPPTPRAWARWRDACEAFSPVSAPT